MKTIPENVLNFLRERYPEGTRIQIRELSGEGREAAPGGIGTLEREKTPEEAERGIIHCYHESDNFKKFR